MIIFVWLLLLAAAATGEAAPSISSVGSFTHGGSTTISGTDFGTKSTAAPWVWDDFDDGTDGQVLGTSPKGFWTLYFVDGSSGIPSYSTIGRRNGGLLVQKECTGEQFASYGRAGLGGTEMYYTHWFKWERILGADDRAVVKLIRLNTQGGFYSPTPSIFVSLQPDVSSGGWLYGEPQNGSGGIGQLTFSPPGISHNAWHRIEFYWRLSTPGVADGEARFYLDGVQYGAWNNVVTRASGSASAEVDNFLLPFMHSLAETRVYKYSADDVYVDRTRARVEVCAGSTWANRGLCEIQIPTAWSATAVTVTGNVGGMASFAGKYLYVIDSSGEVNATGYAISADSTPSPRFAPTLNLRIAQVEP